MESEIVNDFIKEPDDSVKLYSSRTMWVGVFIGGLVTAGVLMRKNYQALGKPQAALNALMLGILSTVALVSLIVLLPESLMDKVPNALIPVIYTGLVLLIFEVTQGDAVRKHQEAGGTFYSFGRVVLIGLFWMVVNIGLVFGSVYLSDSLNEFDQEIFSQKMDQYIVNEEEALKVFGMLENTPREELAEEMKASLKLYRENGKIINEIFEMKGISPEQEEMIHAFEKYNNLRIAHFELLYKAVSENTDEYDVRLGRILNEIQLMQNDHL